MEAHFVALSKALYPLLSTAWFNPGRQEIVLKHQHKQDHPVSECNNLHEAINSIFKNKKRSSVRTILCLRNRSAPAVNCLIIHFLGVSCKEDQIMSA